MTTGLTFSADEEYVIDVKFLYPTTVDRMGIIRGNLNTNVETYDVTLHKYTKDSTQSGDVNALLVADASDIFPSSGLTFRVTKTSDGEPPKNVVMYIEGCNELLPSTKAQVEEVGEQPGMTTRKSQ